MKRSVVALCCVLIVAAACTDKKSASAEKNLQEELLADSLFVDDEEGVEDDEQDGMSVAEVPMPVAAEELFDDFFFNYASSMRVQLQRTQFPLLVTKGELTDTIERSEWQFTPFFMEQGYYTLIFENDAQVELVKDTAINHTVVETFADDADMVVQYHFRRIDGQWQLCEARWQPLIENPNASFVQFYRRFVADSLFQRQSLAQIIEFTGGDSEEEESESMEGFITPDSWEGFAPQFPELPLYNIVYGHQDSMARQKIFVIRGIANGEEMEVTFKREGDNWKLIKLFE